MMYLGPVLSENEFHMLRTMKTYSPEFSRLIMSSFSLEIL